MPLIEFNMSVGSQRLEDFLTKKKKKYSNDDNLYFFESMQSSAIHFSELFFAKIESHVWR